MFYSCDRPWPVMALEGDVPRVYRSRVDTTDFSLAEEGGADDGGTEFHVVRPGQDGRKDYHGARVVLSDFRNGPYEDPDYVFPADDTYVVVDGEIVVEIEGLDPLVLRAGDIASFEKGTKAKYSIASSVRWICIR
jgi:ethanolamine utilization protein EutQ (cupin superfamily)